MTAYFDEVLTRVHNINKSNDDAFALIFALDEQCVRDVSICAEWPGLPSWARNAIHRTVVLYSWAANSELPTTLMVEPDDAVAYAKLATELADVLHGVFHEIGTWARAQVDEVPFTDDPRTPMFDHVDTARRLQHVVANQLVGQSIATTIERRRLAMGHKST